MGVLCVEHANVLELCYIELLSGDGSPYSILSVTVTGSFNLSVGTAVVWTTFEWQFKQHEVPNLNNKSY